MLVFSSEKTAILVYAKIEGSAVAAGSHRVEDYAIFSGFGGDFQVLKGNILMLLHPSSGDNIFCKVRDVNHIILLDSFGKEPKEKKHYILKKKKMKV